MTTYQYKKHVECKRYRYGSMYSITRMSWQLTRVPWRCIPGRSVPLTVRPLDFCNKASPGQSVPWTKDPHNFCDKKPPNLGMDCLSLFSTLWSNWVWNKCNIFDAAPAAQFWRPGSGGPVLAAQIRQPGSCSPDPAARILQPGSCSPDPAARIRRLRTRRRCVQAMGKGATSFTWPGAGAASKWHSSSWYS
jgi:hypothetical protein